jgi:hypothetical protein
MQRATVLLQMQSVLVGIPKIHLSVQDLIDNEILESVPKTIKAKVQLLLKKMKSSLDISWNEKEELKYKG